VHWCVPGPKGFWWTLVHFFGSTNFRQQIFCTHLVGAQRNLAALYSVYTIQPVVKPIVQPVWWPVGCLYTRYNLLSNRLSNRFDNRLYRVYKHSTGCPTVLTAGLNRVNGVLVSWPTDTWSPNFVNFDRGSRDTMWHHASVIHWCTCFIFPHSSAL